jgi:hypothetical protein
MNKRKPAGSRIERQIITAMIVSTEFLKEISPLYSIHQQSPLSLSWASIIADWCIEYFDKYKKAPTETIQDLFHNKTKIIRDQTQIELIEKFLSGISEEYEDSDQGINIPYLLDEAEKYFSLQRVKQAYEDIRQSISRNDIDQAESIIGGFKRIARPKTIGIDPIGDMEVIEDAFNSEDRDFLFRLPEHLGAISEFLGPFERGSLIAFMGKEGAGKSWFLQQLSLESVKTLHNSLFISMEMSQKKMVRRMHQYLNMETKKGKIGDVLIPVFDCKLNQENNCSHSQRTCNVGILDKKGQKPKWVKEKIDGEYKIKFFPRISTRYKPCTACRGEYNWMGTTWFMVKRKRGLSVYKAKNKGRALTESMLRGKKIKFIQYPVGTKSMQDLVVNLQNMIFYENFYPDLLITDYASKFLPESKEEKRHQLRGIYEKHKAIAQEYHIQVITASQTNVTRKDDKMGTKAITKGSWQETMAPQAECDKTFAINQTALEKNDGIMKLNMLKERDDEYDQLKELTILYSHDLGRAILDSEILKKWD